MNAGTFPWQAILAAVPNHVTVPAMPMTYEQYLDEVTTLMTEFFDVSDEDAIKHVMRAQAADYFTLHDDLPEMRTQERAEQDARTIYEQRNKSRPHVPSKRPATNQEKGPAKGKK